MVDEVSDDIFFPQGDPAPWPGNTTQSSLSFFNFWRESNKWSVRVLTVMFLSASLAKSGLPASPQNKVSPVNTNSSFPLSPMTMHIDSRVWPGVAKNLNLMCPRVNSWLSETWMWSKWADLFYPYIIFAFSCLAKLTWPETKSAWKWVSIIYFKVDFLSLSKSIY